jgi:ATP-dependent RNA helicase DDX49/DBP8
MAGRCPGSNVDKATDSHPSSLHTTRPGRYISLTVRKTHVTGRDCIGGAKTGSGKTIAFAAPILQKWSQDPYGIFALILTPTRELALQIADQFLALGASVNLKLTTVLGGTSQLTQAISLSHRPHVVVATPGRLADLIMSSSGDDIAGGFRRCKMLVLDEADRLLESTFADDLSICMDVLPKASQGRQTLLFTATITDDIRAIKSRPLKPGQKPPFLTEINTETCGPSPFHKLPYLNFNLRLVLPFLRR